MLREGVGGEEGAPADSEVSFRKVGEQHIQGRGQIDSSLFPLGMRGMKARCRILVRPSRSVGGVRV